MPVPLSPLLDALDARRADFLRALRGIPPAERERSPSPGAWSPLQIAEHLVLVEEVLTAGAEQQVRTGPARKDVGEPNEAKVEAVLTALRTPAQMKIPNSARGIEPSGEPDLPTLEARWAAVSERLRALVAALPPELANVALLKHPAAGPLRLDQAVRFLEAHVAHHLHQLARTVRALAPPAA